MTNTSPLIAPAVKEPKAYPHALFIVMWIATISIAVIMLLGVADKVTIGVLGIVVMLLQLLLGIPIGIAMISSSVVGLIGLGGYKVAAASTSSVMYDSIASWTLNVVPLFVLMGVAMWKGGVTTRAYAAARQWFSWLPGGLAVSTTFAGAVLATSSGSTMGITFALGRMALPEMLSAGYRASLATASVAMAGTLGQLIPPSILLVIYAGVSSVSIGDQLLAGIVPGLLLALAFTVTILIWATLRPSHAPRPPRDEITWASRLRSGVGLIPIVVIVLVVLGGMYVGLFTASEAAAYGALVAVVVGWLMAGRGKRGLKDTWIFLKSVVWDTATSIAGLFLIIIGAYMIGRLLTLSTLAQKFSTWLVDLQLNRIELLLLLIVFYIVLGMFLESLPMILLTVPLLQAPLEALGVDMIWFGIFLVLMCEIGMVFPPIGILTFVVHRLAQAPETNMGVPVRLNQVFAGTMPFVAAAIGLTVLLILWPDIVLWLPSTGAK